MSERLKIAIIVKGGAVHDVLMSPAAEEQVHYIVVDLDENGDSPAVPAAFVDAIPELQDLVDQEKLDVVEDDDDDDTPTGPGEYCPNCGVGKLEVAASFEGVPPTLICGSCRYTEPYQPQGQKGYPHDARDSFDGPTGPAEPEMTQEEAQRELDEVLRQQGLS